MKDCYKKFSKKIYLYNSMFGQISNEYFVMEGWRRRCLIEALVNQVWQDWSEFVRSIIILSVEGCETRAGIKIAPKPSRTTWQEIAYDALPAHKRNSKQTKIQYKSQEPTWGDWNKLPNIITSVKPANHTHLLSVFGNGAFIRGPKDLQTFRNALIHKNSQTIREVCSGSGIIKYYTGPSIGTIHELCWLYENNTKAKAVFKWLDDFQNIADLATK